MDKWSWIEFWAGVLIGTLSLLMLASHVTSYAKEALLEATGKHHELRWVPVEEAEEKDGE